MLSTIVCFVQKDNVDISPSRSTLKIAVYTFVLFILHRHSNAIEDTTPNPAMGLTKQLDHNMPFLAIVVSVWCSACFQLKC